MATVYQHPRSPFWYGKYTDPETQKRIAFSTGERNKKEALKVAHDREAEARKAAKKDARIPRRLLSVLDDAARDAAAGDLTLRRAQDHLKRLMKIANPEYREPSLSEAWSEWRGLQSVSQSTAQGYAEAQKLFAAALGASVMKSPIGELKEEQIERAVRMAKKSQGGKGRGEKTRKASTVNQALSCLRRMLEWAVGREMIHVNAAKNVKPLPETDSSERGPFTRDEVQKLIAAAPDDQWRGIIIMAAHTGLRIGDLVRLSPEFIDGSRIVLRPKKTSRLRKTVSVPLSPPAFGWIGSREGPFFPGIAALSSPERSMTFGRIMEGAGVKKRVTLAGGITIQRSFHSFRHTFASWLAEADVHADIRQKLTGHSSSRIHQKYTHHDEALERAISLLPDFSG